MLREFKEGVQLKMDIYLKSNDSGRVIHTKKDIPENPFGVSFEVISFWEGDKLVIYPFDRVDHCELYEDTNK